MYPVLTLLTVSSNELEGEGRGRLKRVGEGDEWKSEYDMLFFPLKRNFRLKNEKTSKII